MRSTLWLVASALVAETAYAQVQPAPVPTPVQPAPVPTPVAPVKATAKKLVKGPAKPELLVGNRTFVAFGSKAAAVRIAWSPVSSVARYRVRWFDGDKTNDYDLAASTPLLERAEDRAGSHRLQVVAIDDAGVESEPAEATIDIVAVEAISPWFCPLCPHG